MMPYSVTRSVAWSNLDQWEQRRPGPSSVAWAVLAWLLARAVLEPVGLFFVLDLFELDTTT